MFVKMGVATIIITLFVIITVIIAIYFFFFRNKVDDSRIRIEEGNFFYFDQSKWKHKPVISSSSNTLLGSFIFDDERYNPTIDSNLYCGKTINKNQAWVIRGMSSKVLKYWSYGLYSVIDTTRLNPIGITLNNVMAKDSRNGDDIVAIVSPNYKFAQHIANLIAKKEYNKKLADDKHVIFRYFPMPNFDASLKYTMLFEAYKSNAGANPKIKAYRYTYENRDDFPFYPVEDKKPKTINEKTVDETKLNTLFQVQVDRQLSSVKNASFRYINTYYNSDYLYVDSDILDVKEGDKFIVAVMDHSSTGKCLYSELMFIDGNTKIPYKTHLISEFDPSNIDPSGKIKTYSHIVPKGIKRMFIAEKIVIDMSTGLKPDPNTIIPSGLYSIQ